MKPFRRRIDRLDRALYEPGTNRLPMMTGVYHLPPGVLPEEDGEEKDYIGATWSSGTIGAVKVSEEEFNAELARREEADVADAGRRRRPAGQRDISCIRIYILSRRQRPEDAPPDTSPAVLA